VMTSKNLRMSARGECRREDHARLLLPLFSGLIGLHPGDINA